VIVAGFFFLTCISSCGANMFGFYCKLHDGMQPIGNIHSMQDEIERLQERLQELLITSLVDINRRRGSLIGCHCRTVETNIFLTLRLRSQI
jgi:hypothetical protein